MVYAMACMFLIMGARMAFKTSNAGGAGATAAVVKGRGLAVGKWLSYRGGYREAAEKRWDQFKREGFQNEAIRRSPLGFFGGTGKEGYEKRVAGAGARLGVRGAEKKFYGADVERIKRDYDELQKKFELRQITKEDVLRDYSKFDPRDSRGLAYRKLMAEKGFMPANVYFETLDALGDNPYAVEDFAKSAKEGKFGNLNEIDPTDPEKKKVISHLKGIATAKPDSQFHYERFRSAAFRPFREEAYNAIGSDPVQVSSLSYGDV